MLVSKGQKTITRLDDGYTIRLTPSSIIIPANNDGTNPVLSSAKSRIFLEKSGTNIPITINSLTTTACTATFSSNEITITAISANEGSVQINFKTTDDSYTSSVQITYTVSKQGEDAYTVLLDNESHALSSTHNGVVTAEILNNAKTKIIVYKGSKLLTSVASNATPTTNQFKYVVDSVTGGTATRIDNDNVRLATITEDVAIINLKIYVEGLTKVFDKKMTLTKVKGSNPEELNQLRSETTTKFEVLETSINSKVSQTDYNALNQRVGTAETSISQNATAINLRAIKTEVTSEINTAVNNVTIGGTNLVLNSNSASLFLNNSSSVLTKTVVAVTEWGATDANRITSTGGSSSMKAFYSLKLPKSGEIFTSSIYIKNNSTTDILTINSNLNNKAITVQPNTVTRVVFEGLVGDGGKSIHFQLLTPNSSKDLDITWWRMQLENGNKVTAWSPAPEDNLIDINSAISKISIGGRNYLKNTTNLVRTFTMGAWDAQVGNKYLLFSEIGVYDGIEITYRIYLINGDGTRTNGIYARVDLNDTKGVTANKYSMAIGNAIVKEGYSTVTFKITSAEIALYDRFSIHIGRNDGATDKPSYTISYKEQKVEIGNKATDWSIAPEDTDATITALTTRVSTAETNISQSNTAINLRALKTDVTTEITSAVSNVTIGGRNLLAQTKTGGLGSYKTTDLYQGFNIVRRYRIVGATGTIETFVQDALVITSDKYYTASFWAKASVNTTVQCFWYSTTTNTTPKFTSSVGLTNTVGVSNGQVLLPITTSWVKYWITWETTDTLSVAKRLILGRIITDDVTVEIAGVKLESGNKATEWTPAPEDMDGTVSALTTRVTNTEASINILNTGISLKADKTVTDSLLTRMDGAELKITPEAIQQTVKAQTETISNTAVNNLLIGTENLLNYSGNFKSTLGWYQYQTANAEYVPDGLLRLNPTATSGDNSRVMNLTNIPLWDKEMDLYITVNYKSDSYIHNVGGKYRNSTLVEQGNLTWIATKVSDELNGDIRTSYYKFKTPIKTEEKSFLFFYIYIKLNIPVTLINVKIEKGTKGSDWSPSVQEVLGIGSSVNLLPDSRLRNPILLNTHGVLTNTSAIPSNIPKFTKINTTNAVMAYATALADRTITFTNNETYCITFEARGTLPINYIYVLKSENGNVNLNGSNMPTFSDTVYNETTFTKYYKVYLSNFTSNTVGISIGYSGTAMGWFEITKLMVEKASYPSDWSLSAQDIDSNFGTLTTRITNAETSITQSNTEISLRATKTEVTNQIATAKSEAISTASTDATTKANNATSNAKTYTDSQITITNTAIGLKADKTVTDGLTTRMNSAELKITPEAIQQTVKAQTDTIVSTAVNNINIGGRNYLAMSGFNVYTQYYTGTLVNGLLTLKRVSSTVGTIALGNTNYINLNGEYTFSGYVTINGVIPTTSQLNLNVSFNTQNGSKVNYTYNTTTGFFVATHNYVGATSAWIMHGANFILAVNDTIVIREAKFEKGNKPTAWTPAPEDTDATITALTTRVSTAETSINQTKTDITLRALKTDVTTEIATAVNNITVGGRNYLRGTSNVLTNVSLGSWNARVPNYRTGLLFSELGVGVGDTVTLRMYLVNQEGRTNTLRARLDLFKADDTYVTNVSNQVLPISGGYATLTYKLTENDIANYVGFGILFSRSDGSATAESYTIQYKEIKFEKGDKATSWTPAPEDTDATITALTTRVSTSEANITLANNAINLRALKTDVTTEVTNAVNNVTVGGRNLLSQTKNASLQTGRVTTDLYQGFNIVKNTKSSTSNADVFTQTTINPATEKYYTVSFWAKSSIPSTITSFWWSPSTTKSGISSTGQTSTRVDGGTDITLTTSWKRYWITWEQTDTTAIKTLVIGRILTDTAVVEVAGVKLESGNKPTEWSPAPEDTDATISALTTRVSTSETNISLTNEAINLRALKTEVATDITTAVNNISIGGTNLLLNTATNRVITGTNTSNQTSFLYYFSFGALSNLNYNDNDFYVLKFNWEVTGTTVSGTFYHQVTTAPWTFFRSNVTTTISDTNRKGTYIIIAKANGGVTTSTALNLTLRCDNLVGVLTISKAKLELGTKATAWSPAPEDIETTVSGLTTRVSTSETNISLANEAINLRATKTEVTTAVNNIQIGGTNLIIRYNEQIGKIANTGGNLTAYTGHSVPLNDIDVTAGKNYYFTKTAPTNGYDDLFRIVWLNSSNTEVLREFFNNNSLLKVAPTGAVKLRLSYNTSSKVKLEEGTKPTAWSPAPEDMDGTVSALTSRVSTAETSINVANEAINLRATKTEVTTAVNNIQIGGTNLLVNSNSGSLFVTSSNSVLTKSVVAVTEWGATDANRIVSTGGTGGVKANYVLKTPRVGEILTSSIYIKNNSTTDVLSLNTNLNNKTVTVQPNTATRVVFEGIVGDGTNNLQMQLRAPSSDKNIDVTWWRMQLENGNKVSDWSPSPQDNTNEINNAVSNVTIGGRNLLLDTNKGLTGWKWNLGGTTSAGAIETVVTENGIDCPNLVRTSATATWSFIAFSNIKLSLLKVNTVYTLSFEVKSTIATSLVVQIKTSSSTLPLTNSKTLMPISVVNTWTKVSCELTTVAEFPTVSAQLLYFSSVNNTEGSGYMFRNIKLEEGNKATAWSPAPEDIENTVTLLSTRVSNTEASITLANNAINLRAIKTEVATDITNAVNNITVGGTNLLAQTKTGGLGSFKTTDLYQGFNIVRRARTTSNVDTFTQDTINPATDKYYTVSFWAKSSVAQTVNCYWYYPSVSTTKWAVSSTGQTGGSTDGQIGVNITTTWTKYWVTWEQNTHTGIKKLIVGRILTDNSTVEIAGVKLESGNKPTEWSPAPEDTDTSISTLTNRISSAETSINVANEAINLRAIKTEVAVDITNAVNNVSIGGTNLLLDSNNGNKFIAVATSVLTKSTVTVTEWGATDANRIVSTGGTSTTKTNYTYGIPKVGEILTVSIYIKNNSTTDSLTITSNLNSKTTTIPANTATRVVFEGLVGTGVNSIQLSLIVPSSDKNIDVTWWRIQIENGNKVTAWSPAPQDNLIDINNAITSIYIGGRNYLLNSNKVSVTSGLGNGITRTNNASGSMTFVATSGNGNYAQVNYTASPSWGTDIKVGDTVTFSCDIKVSSGTTLPTFYFNGSNGYTQLQGEVSSTTFKRCYLTRVLTTAVNIDLYLGFGGVSGTYEVRNFKIEKGNKASEWTYAPEDIDTTISNISTRVTTAETNISQTITDISLKADKSVTDGLSTRLNNAELKITADAINLTVKSQTETIANTAINNVSLGGTNLILDSNNPNKINGHNGATLTKTVVTVTEWGATDANRIVSTGGSETIKGIFAVSPYPSGVLITMSIYVKNNSTTDVLNIFTNQGSKGTTIQPNTATRVVFEGILNNGTGSPQFQFISSAVAKNLDFTWWRIQIEKGNKVTEWSPAPEDIERTVKNISVGGRNLIINSKSTTTLPYIDQNNVTTALSTTPLTPYGTSGTTIALIYNGTASNYFRFLGVNRPNTEYTFSCWMYRPTDTLAIIYEIGANNVLIKNVSVLGWTKIEVTFTSLSSVSVYNFVQIKSLFTGSANAVWIYEPKLEEGNKATAWSPAPEDIDTSLANLRTSINQTITDISLKADKSITDNLGTRLTNAEALITADAINLTVKNQVTAKSNGKMLYRDPMFLSGMNGINVYNNLNNGNVTITRETNITGLPTGNSSRLTIKATGAGDPHYGGFHFAIPTYMNSRFLFRFKALIPIGGTVVINNNAIGNGSSINWLTPQAGTGKYEDYMVELIAGSSGTFSTSGFFSLAFPTVPTTANPLIWYLCFATAYDLNQVDDTPSVAEIKSGIEITSNAIKVFGQELSLAGKVTFSSLDTTTQSLVNAEVGGRNYFKKTTYISAYDGASNLVMTNNNGGFYVTGSQANTAMVRINEVITGNGWWTVSFEHRIVAVPGFLLSVDICDLGGITTTAQNGTWQKVVCTVNVTNYTDTGIYNFVDINRLTGQVHEFRNIKVEKGSKATDWSPAPEDVDSSILNLETKTGIGTLPANTTIINGGKINTTLINTDTLIAKQIKTSENVDRLSVNEDGDNTLKIRHSNGATAIEMGLVGGEPRLVFYNNSGTKLWEGGMQGIVYVNNVAESWTTQNWIPITTSGLTETSSVPEAEVRSFMEAKTVVSAKQWKTTSGNTTYYYNEGNNSTSTSNAQYRGYHTSNTKSTSNWVSNGWYTVGNTTLRVNPNNVYYVLVFKLWNGQIVTPNVLVTLPYLVDPNNGIV